MIRRHLSAWWLAAGVGLLAGPTGLLLASARAEPDAAVTADANAATTPDLASLLAEKPSVVASAYVSADAVVLGQTFSLLVVVNAERPGGRLPDVEVPTSLDLGPAFEFGRRFKERVTRVGGIEAIEIQIEMIAWQVGDLRLPPVPVDVPLAGAVNRVHTAPITVKVVGLVGDDGATLRDIAEPMPVLRRDPWSWYAAGAALLVIAALLGWWWWRRAHGRSGSSWRVGDSHAARALRGLQALRAGDWLAGPDPAPLVRQMNEIVRTYIDRELEAPALDLTTRELLRDLRDRGRLPVEILDELLAPWLQACDLVKYAHARVSPDEVRRLHEQACTIVEKTRADDRTSESTGDSAGGDTGVPARG